MAAISFNVHSTYFTDPGDQCTGTDFTITRYYDDSTGSLAAGSTIYIDVDLTQPDGFLENGVDPKDNVQYIYDLSDNTSLLVDAAGKVLDVTTCSNDAGPGSEQIQLGNGQVDEEGSCNTASNDFIAYANVAAALLNVGDVIYQDTGLSSVYAGNDLWYYVYDLQITIQISDTGEITDIKSCGGSDASTQILISEPVISAASACKENPALSAFIQVGLNDLTLGTIIYEDPGFTQPLKGDNAFIYVDVADIAVQVDDNGIVLQVVDCSTTSTWAVNDVAVLFSTSSYNDLCVGDYALGKFYYPSLTGTKTVLELATGGIPIFMTANDAQTWIDEENNGEPHTWIGVFPTCWAFTKTGSTTEWYVFWDSTLKMWANSGAETQCTTVAYEIFSIKLELQETLESGQTAAQYCNSAKKTITAYYKWIEGEQLSILKIAKNNVYLYKTPSGADYQLSSVLLEAQIVAAYEDSTGWYAYEEAGPSGVDRKWYGFNIDGDLAYGNDIVEGGSCGDYTRGIGYGTELISSTSPYAAKVFYAMWSCIPVIVNDSISFPMYIVDGDHFLGEYNYFSDFISIMLSTGLTTYKNNATGECMTYMHTVVAEDIAEATFLLENTGGYTDVQQREASSVGVFSNNSVSLRNSCEDCINSNPPSGYFQFPEIEGSIPTDLGPAFDLETNYKLDNVARPLLRTNPKLTTNIKIIADSSDKIYLESISATKDLANVEYKRNELNKNGSYAYDLPKFYSSKKTPDDIIYSVKRADSDLSVLEKYENQIEEDYQYGATINYSKLYDEKFRIFAPIWADLNMPKKFVIFKVNNPANKFGLKNNATDNFTRIQSILSNSEIVKVFDLTRNTAIGTYIRNHVQDENFPTAPLTFSFEKNEKSSYNGIDLIKGGFTEKPEYLYSDFVKKDKPLIEANDFITDGFRRNSMVNANILNLEFLFDDDTAVDYSVNRYFGLYVDDIDSGIGSISSVKNGKIKFSAIESYVNANTPASAIPSSKLMNTTPTLGYVSIANEYFKISNNKYYDESKLNIEAVDPSNKIPNYTGISFNNKSVDIRKWDQRGYDFVKFKVVDNPVVNDNIALTGTKEEAFSFKFIKHVPNQLVTIADSHIGHSFQFNTGVDVAEAYANFKQAFNVSALEDHFYFSSDSEKVYLTEKLAGLGNLNLVVSIASGNIIKLDRIYTNVNLYANTIFAAAPGELTKGTFSDNKFSSDGTTVDIAIAMTALINTRPRFTAFNDGDLVYVKIDVPGYRILQHALLVNRSNNSLFVKVDNEDFDGTILGLSEEAVTTWDAYYFNGGNNIGKSALIDTSTLSEINVGDYISTNYKNKYNKIIDIVEHIEGLNTGYHKLILDQVNTIEEGNTRVFSESLLRVGLFSAYDVYDLNFDFYDTSNSDLKELDLEESDNIKYSPYTDVSMWTDPNSSGYRLAYAGLTTDEIISEFFTLSPIDYFSNILPLLENENIDGTSYEQIYSEYDRLKENSTKEFSLNSRIVPTINKWVLKGTDTVRQQPYYLNSSEAFGRTNFAPDLSVEGRDRKSFTHEWFYLDKLPSFYRYDQVADVFSYVNFIQDFDLTKEMFESTDNNYFDRFMYFDGIEVSSDSSNLMNTNPDDFDSNSFLKSVRCKKYTTISDGNDISFASTFFKGIKVILKSRKEFDNATASEFVKNNEFNGYKFTTLVKVNTNTDASSIDYDVIQNKKFKFVIFFITLNISDFWLDGSLSRKLLYELNHKMVYDLSDAYGDGIGQYIYSDVNLSGALRLNATDFTTKPYIVSGIQHTSGSSPEFDTQISAGADDLYGRILMDFGTGVTYASRVLSINSSSELVLEGVPYDITDPSNLLPTTYLPESIQASATYTYEGGGVNAHSTLLNKLSIQYVADLLNLGSDGVTYKTIEEDGTILHNRFILNFEDGKEVVKVANLTVEEDVNKPKSYKLSKGTIGYNIVEGETYYPFIIRHSGKYSVDMRPVITFTDVYTHFKVNRDHTTLNPVEREFREKLYKHSLSNISEISIARSYYKKYNRTGTTFNLNFIEDNGAHDSKWGIIKNHFYHKVNDINPNGVTKLTETSEFLPLYPLIGEIAIDKKDLNVFRSSWDSDYYTRSLAGGKSETVPGTFDTIEERSYFASTMMTIEESYILLDYTYTSVESEEELDDILRNSNNESDVVLFEDDTRVIADFYMDSVIYKRLRDSGVLNTLSNFILAENSVGDKTTMIDDAQEYITKNLMDIFTVDNLQLYTKSFKGRNSTIVSSDSTNELESDGYNKDNNFTYKPHAQTAMNFRLIYNKRLGYSYDIKPMIKIKS